PHGLAFHERVRLVGVSERLVLLATLLLRARVRVPGVARSSHARTLYTRRRGARSLDRPRDPGTRRQVERGRGRRMAAAGMAGARDGAALSARGPRATRVLEPAQRRAHGRERGVRRLGGRWQARGGTGAGR